MALLKVGLPNVLIDLLFALVHITIFAALLLVCFEADCTFVLRVGTKYFIRFARETGVDVLLGHFDK